MYHVLITLRRPAEAYVITHHGLYFISSWMKVAVEIQTISVFSLIKNKWTTLLRNVILDLVLPGLYASLGHTNLTGGIVSVEFCKRTLTRVSFVRMKLSMIYIYNFAVLSECVW